MNFFPDNEENQTILMPLAQDLIPGANDTDSNVVLSPGATIGKTNVQYDDMNADTVLQPLNALPPTTPKSLGLMDNISFGNVVDVNALDAVLPDLQNAFPEEALISHTPVFAGADPIIIPRFSSNPVKQVVEKVAATPAKEKANYMNWLVVAAVLFVLYKIFKG